MAFRLSPHLTVMQNAVQRAAKRLLRDFAEVEQLQVSVIWSCRNGAASPMRPAGMWASS